MLPKTKALKHVQAGILLGVVCWGLSVELRCNQPGVVLMPVQQQAATCSCSTQSMCWCSHRINRAVSSPVTR